MTKIIMKAVYDSFAIWGMLQALGYFLHHLTQPIWWPVPVDAGRSLTTLTAIIVISVAFEILHYMAYHSTGPRRK